MDVAELKVPGTWVFTPEQWRDPRGVVLEWFKAPVLREAVGHDLVVRQANHSVSAKGTVRGVHFADVPPGQAKYVYCTRGAFLDVVVDIRVGSPAFGVCDVVQIDSETRRAVYICEGVGHALIALTDDANATYLCSEPHNPGREHGINPLDPALGLPIPQDIELKLSDKDAEAPTLAEAKEQGLLPSYQECVALYESLRIGHGQ